MSETIRVDIWSDIACPWCYIGKRRFEGAVQRFQDAQPEISIEVTSHSFELAPDTPDDFEGSEIDFLVKHKGMPKEQVEEMLGQMTQLAAADGITFNFDTLRHANTRRAHRVLHLAKSQGLQSELLERLFAAYFAEGMKISDPETLAALGEEVGLDADEVRDAFDDEALGEAVDADTTRARMLGINGVPFFLLDEQYGVSGAQSVDAFESVLQQVLELRAGQHV